MTVLYITDFLSAAHELRAHALDAFTAGDMKRSERLTDEAHGLTRALEESLRNVRPVEERREAARKRMRRGKL